MNTIAITTELLQSAFDALWSNNLAVRARGHDFHGQTFYVTAADLERKVRELGAARLGVPEFYVRARGDLHHRCRDWLMHHPELVGHNFGRGHCSGMRFRPRGEPIGPTAEKTMQEKAKRATRPAVVHFSPSFARPLCSIERRKAQDATRGRPTMFWSRSTARTSNHWAKVTCKQCLKFKDMQK